MSSTLPPIIEDDDGSIGANRFDLVEMLLSEQQSMTAVERFSAFHDDHPDTTFDQPDQARFYRDLLPATPPLPGQQLSFQVDLDACSGCKACVVACHTMNGLEDEESWRRVGTITVGQGADSRVQHVTTACHHCEDPGCLNGCPVKAYDKDPATGIVRHLDDQCIGCKYCTMMCPYEVPRYSERLGIVRKCDMCHQRLSVGEAPACVQSCPNQAIAIRTVAMSERKYGEQDRLSPGAPLSSMTRPSTKYRTHYKKQLRSAVAQDAGVDEVAESHWPLAVMLVATQFSVGMLLIERLATATTMGIGGTVPAEATRINALLSLCVAVVGMLIAPKHLGQPLRAWRVFLGLKTSWLSREAVVLGKYVGMLALAVGLLWMPLFAEHLPAEVASMIPDWLARIVLSTAVAVGAAGLYCSAMIYVATRRELWRSSRTLIRFFGSAVIGGAVGSSIVFAWAGATTTAGVMAMIAALLLTTKLRWEWIVHLGPHRNGQDETDRRSRRLVRHQLVTVGQTRISAGMITVCLLVVGAVLALDGISNASLSLLGAAAVMVGIGELAERLLYFSSVVYDRMPGTLPSGAD